ncbi:cation diffusion facilitator family transporter [Paracoccus versutus]|uniref:Cobalt-zinc-cadmium efflux system protein n=1 Tax=Paracoccus versutus TaxID=34007 RepID=A0A3D9XSN6_PARVE|nr:cation diffusion facilitator family transporter [Paracoccus versutus]REF73415.1 cobalt-zinc-cadmium efflux system protein [Paracoccus versutus]WGR54566.1 cation diffusion facilitator family transporter [Paracoccus versutus]
MAHQHDHGPHAGHHHHDHDHSHVPAVTGENERKILISFFIIFGFMLVEAIGGLLSGSLALLADAGHMLTDAIALGLAYAAFRLGRRAADSKRSFGYARFEVIAGLINALTLFGIVGFILYEAIARLREPQPVLAGWMFVVAVIGMLVNLFVLWFLTRGDTGHVNVKGAVLHVMGDLLGSVGAIAAAVVIWFTGWTPIDPVLSVFVSLLILRSAWSLLKNTLHILLEGAPDDAGAERIAAHLKANVDGIEDVGHVHVWQITSGRALATLKIRPTAGADLMALTTQAEQILRSEFDIEHPTVGIDWTGTESCSLDRPAAPSGHIGHSH